MNTKTNQNQVSDLNTRIALLAGHLRQLDCSNDPDEIKRAAIYRRQLRDARRAAKSASLSAYTRAVADSMEHGGGR